MTIQVIQGKPGGGKSYLAVLRVKEAIEAGRVVVTNLPLKADQELWADALASGQLVLMEGRNVDQPNPEQSFSDIRGWRQFYTDPQRWQTQAKTGGGETAKIGPLIVVDEAAGTFQKWSSDKRRKEEWQDFTEMLRIHRHHLQDIILLYQDYSQLTGGQGDVKALVERWYTITNTSEMTGANTWNLVAKAKGFSLSKGANLEEKSGRYQKAVFDLYDSYAEGGGKGTKGKKGTIGLFKARPIWLRWWFILLVGCVVLLPLFMWRTATGIKGLIDPEVNTTAGFGTPASEPVAKTTAKPSLAPSVGVQEPVDYVAGEKILRGGVDLPAPSVPFVGFDRYELFFADGSRASILSHFEIAGFRVIEMEACSVKFAQIVAESEREVLEYRCTRNF